jgi:hypothetical protein
MVSSTSGTGSDAEPTSTAKSSPVIQPAAISSTTVAGGESKDQETEDDKGSTADKVQSTSTANPAPVLSETHPTGKEETIGKNDPPIDPNKEDMPKEKLSQRTGKVIQKMEEAKKGKEEQPPAQALNRKPEPDWEQHKPGPNDETLTPKDQLAPRPDWYKKDTIDDIERSMLPEWFDSSASHRTPETYLKAREKIIEISDSIANRNVTNAMIRRVIVGDAGSLQRLRTFLVNWGVINEDAINDSAPTPASLRSDLKRRRKFTENMKGDLIMAVVQQAKRRKTDENDSDHDMGVASSSSSFIPIDWEEVASQVGHGASAEDCQQNFMMATLKDEPPAPSTERPITPDTSRETSKAEANTSSSSNEHSPYLTKEAMQKEFVRDLVERSDPETLREVFDAAMKSSGCNLCESQAASILGLQLTRTVEEARGYEVDLASRLSRLVDLRMQKLENRMAMMDDIEAILEAEKVALELERRDLYTARCRHWFGGV